MAVFSLHYYNFHMFRKHVRLKDRMMKSFFLLLSLVFSQSTDIYRDRDKNLMSDIKSSQENELKHQKIDTHTQK